MEQVQIEHWVNNMKQVQIEHWETDIWKLNEFSFLNEEVEFWNTWSPNLVNVESPSYLKQKNFQYCLLGTDYVFSFSFWHGDRIWINFSIVIWEKNGVLNAAGV